jgi:uncharacterized protein
MSGSLTYEKGGKIYLGRMPPGSLNFDADGRLYIGAMPPRHRGLATDEAPRFDKDGRLHLATMPLSRASVERYPGSTLIHAGRVTGGSIDPNKTYCVFRPPSELAKAASTFSCLPIVNNHVARLVQVPAADIVGTTGSAARFDDPILAADAVIWSRGALDGVVGGFRSAPSCGYAFDLEIRSGSFRGQRFGAIFRNLEGHHVALCNRGRSDLQITPRARA